MSWLGRYKNPGAPVNNSRVLGTQYTPSTTAYVEHFVTVQLVCTAGQTATVDLLSDTATPPTTGRARASSNIVGTVIQQLTWITAPGDNVKLVASGTGTSSIVLQWEVPLGAPVE